MRKIKIAIAPFLRSCPGVITLGIRETLGDYSPGDIALLREADRIYFPTPRFADIFEAAGKRVFPGSFAYRLARSRIEQVILLQALNLPHPPTRLYFGRNREKSIPSDFQFPLIAMGPWNTPGTIHTICSHEDLQSALSRYNPLIVRRTSVWTERIRLIFIGGSCVGMHRFASSASGRDSWLPISTFSTAGELIEFSLRLLKNTGLDDLALEWGIEGSTQRILHFHRPPVRWETPAGEVRRHGLIAEFIQSGRL